MITLRYKGFSSQVLKDRDSGLFLGKIDNIEDLIMYQGETLREAKRDFMLAIEEYLGLKEDVCAKGE